MKRDRSAIPAPCVSVLMPVFNSAAFVQKALVSIQSQTFNDFELIVIDDGSSDGSAEILDKFAAEESRMRLIRRPNLGLIATRNELLNEARGEFIAWMDSDDLSHPERLKRLVAELRADSKRVCVGSKVRMIDPDGKPLGVETYPQEHKDIQLEQLSGSGFRFPATMQRRSAAIQVGGFREPFRIGEDLDFLLRVGETGRMANVPECLYSYRQHLMSTCTALGANWLAYRDAILSLARERRELGTDKLQRGEHLLLPEPTAIDTERFVPQVLLSWAQGALSGGDWGRALRYMMKAIIAARSSGAVWRSVLRILFRT